MPRLALPAALIACALAGCAVPVAPPGEAPPDLTLCGGEDYAWLVGQNIAAVTLPAGPNIRVIGPDDMVTMDYVPSRLNIEFEESGTIDRLYCG